MKIKKNNYLWYNHVIFSVTDYKFQYDMDILIPLVKIVSSQDFLSSLSGSQKLKKFYTGIKKGVIRTDQEAFQYLYADNVKKNTYYKLKSDLKAKLSNHIVTLNLATVYPKDSPKYWLSYLKKELYILRLLRAKKVPIKILKYIQLLDISKKYRFTEATIEISSFLTNYYTYTEINPSKRDFYWKIIHANTELLKLEKLTAEKYNVLISYYVNNKSKKAFISNLADQYLNELDTTKIEFESAIFISTYYGIWLIKYMGIQDYISANKYGTIGLQKLNQLSYDDQIRKGFFLNNLIVCDIALGTFERGKQRIEKLKENQVKGSSTWFSTNEVGVSLSFYTKNYESAYDIFVETVKYPTFNKQKSSLKDKWLTIAAYLNFLILSDELHVEKLDPLLQNFKVEKYFNSLEIYDRDKKGFYITIWIGYIINLIAEKKYDQLLFIEESFRKFVSRYLSDEQNFRSLIFCKMVLIYIKNDFKSVNCKKDIINYLNELKATTTIISNQEHDIELIPYDFIWEIITSKI